MSLRINTNVPSLMAQHQITRTQRDLNGALAELASGSKFSAPNPDTASHAIAEGLRAQQSGMEVAQRNAEDAVSFVQTAEGSLNEQNNILIRQRELAVQAASDTLSDTERGFLNQEFTQLGQELDRIAQSTYFGSTPLLNGKTETFDFQVGTKGDSNSRIRFENDADTTASSLGVDGLDISDHSDARSALEDIDGAIQKINGVRATFGSVQSRLEAASSFLGTHIDSIAQAYSQLADTDVAEAVTRARRGQILQQYQAAVLSQANATPELALKLVG